MRMMIMSILILGLTLSQNVLSVAKEDAASKVPYLFNVNISGPETFISNVINTNGTIEKICAFWDSEGQVSAQVSANSGNSYTEIVNGQVLESNFLPGNSLIFKASISSNSLLKTLTLGYKDSSGVNKLFINNDLSNFKFKKSLNISGIGKVLYNYPVKLNVGIDLYSQKGLEENFKDIRFVGIDGQTYLSYCIEKVYLKNGLPISADFWVKIPELPKDGINIFLYYGNRLVVDASDPGKVFLFYDDFSSNSLNQEKWSSKTDLNSKISVYDGWSELKNVTLEAKNVKTKEAILEFKAKAQENSAISANIKSFSKDKNYVMEESVFSSAYPGAEHTIAINNVAKLNSGSGIKFLNEYIFQVIFNNNEIVFERFSADYKKEAEIRFLDSNFSDFRTFELKAVSNLYNGGSVFFDWVRVRPYSAIEPKAVLLN